ncbi:MAG: nickel-responsive transcriptional regulator NikR [Holophaga sp.]|nr:nickel-responsive transcriptional regulator NikR [Holophaga sp.]
MSQLERFGVSAEKDLLARFDCRLKLRGYRTRSEALRDLIRQDLVDAEWENPGAEVFGTVTIIFDHHVHGLSHDLAELQHEFLDAIVCNTHVHLDAHNCLEVVIVRGKSGDVRRIADVLIAAKGVKHGQLACSACQ